MPQFTLYSHGLGPNPWKVAYFLEELGLDYETKYMVFDDNPKNGVKSAEFLKLNPNGRVPALQDHKTGKVVWESVPCLLYLQRHYDQSGKYGFDQDGEGWEWLFWQASGLGPYTGQLAWFTFYHHEQVQSAKDRYQKELERNLGVLEGHLKGKEYVVENKLTLVDFNMMAWLPFAGMLNGKNDNYIKEAGFPSVQAYMEKMLALPSVKTAKSKAPKE